MLAILTTHPIQYQVPLWQALAKEGSVPFEVWYLSDHGARAGYDPQFGKSFSWDLNMLAGYPYRFLRVNKGARLDRFEQLRLNEPLIRLFQEKKVKAIWVQGWQVLAYWQAVWQAHRAGVQVWLRGESNDLAPTPAWKMPIKRFLLKQLFRRVNHFLYIGQANRRLYESYGVRPEQLHPSPYCVDNERFARQAEAVLPQREAIRRSWNIPDDAFCVLFAGKFISKKRPLDIVTAVRDLSASGLERSLHLLFAGSGELGGKLREKCKVVFDADSKPLTVSNTPGSKDNLPPASFTGFLNQTEISKAYVAADCLVLPSDSRETWGLVVNEAMASGLPCIASDACGCSEDLIAPLNSDLCFRMGDPSALAKSLGSLLYQRCSPSIVRTHVGKFSIQDSVVTVNHVYQLSSRVLQ